MGGLEKQGMWTKKSMWMEGRPKGMCDLRIRIPSAHLGSGPHAWPDPATQTPNGIVEMEESEMHRLVRHGSKWTGHTAQVALGITSDQGTWCAGIQNLHTIGRKPLASFRGTENEAYDAQAMKAPTSGKCHAGRSSPEKKRTSNGA